MLLACGAARNAGNDGRLTPTADCWRGEQPANVLAVVLSTLGEADTTTGTAGVSLRPEPLKPTMAGGVLMQQIKDNRYSEFTL